MTVAQHIARHVTGGGVVRVVYRAAETELDVGGAPYAVTCVTHGTVAPATSQRAARAAMRTGAWCAGCAARMDAVLQP